MTKNEIRLAAQLLELASNEFANHGCNDFEWPEEWSVKEIRKFVFEWHCWNEGTKNPQDYDPEYLFLQDDSVMGFMAYKLRTRVERFSDTLSPASEATMSGK